MKKEAIKTSFRITSDAKNLIAQLSNKLGINQTSVIEIAIRQMAEREHINHDKEMP